MKNKNSITEFGYVEPIIVNSDMTIIGGHQRATVLQTLGYDEIDCIVIEIDKTKEKALNIALNKITGEWNQELLADLIEDLQNQTLMLVLPDLSHRKLSSYLIRFMIKNQRR